jgi:hypothetical protein
LSIPLSSGVAEPHAQPELGWHRASHRIMAMSGNTALGLFIFALVVWGFFGSLYSWGKDIQRKEESQEAMIKVASMMEKKAVTADLSRHGVTNFNRIDQTRTARRSPIKSFFKWAFVVWMTISAIGGILTLIS